ncbi:hypothetical protein P8R94_19135, partial [Citrobacter freundii]|nr:hypothetical protein [Citrobacter freundii]
FQPDQPTPDHLYFYLNISEQQRRFNWKSERCSDDPNPTGRRHKTNDKIAGSNFEQRLRWPRKR